MNTSQKSFYWYDLETSGLKTSWDHIVQFAGQRTDLDLNPIDEPLSFWVRLPPEVLPSPSASAVTGITPRKINEDGISEWDSITQIHQEFTQPDTCVLGYNNIAFDDEFIRYTLWRNLLPPYEREWKNGNTRFDLMRAVHTVAAFTPDRLDWELNDEGRIVYSLSSIAEKNGIDASNAHDAAADVSMSIAVAQKIKRTAPEVWEYVLRFRDKAQVLKCIEADMPYLMHLSRDFGSRRRHTAVVSVLGTNPNNRNQKLITDLSTNLDLLFEGTPEEAVHAWFLKKEEAEETCKQRLALYKCSINQSPIFLHRDSISNTEAERFTIDLDLVERNREKLANQDKNEFEAKVKEIIKLSEKDYTHQESDRDAAEQLYDGFVSDQDAGKSAQINQALKNRTPWPKVSIEDERLEKLCNRLRYRERPEDEPRLAAKYQEYVKSCLMREDVGLEAKLTELKKTREENEYSDSQLATLNEISNYYHDIAQQFEVSMDQDTTEPTVP